ncbi:MAG: hypothetical protein ABJH19_02695, partial [Roseibium sp.]
MNEDERGVAAQTRNPPSEPATAPPRTGRWKLIGPGIVAAATGVGAGDLVATLIAGSRFGYAL